MCVYSNGLKGRDPSSDCDQSALWPPHPCSPSLCFSPACPEGLRSHDSLGPVHFYLICGIPFRTVCESIIENVVTAEASYLNFKCY